MEGMRPHAKEKDYDTTQLERLQNRLVDLVVHEGAILEPKSIISLLKTSSIIRFNSNKRFLDFITDQVLI